MFEYKRMNLSEWGVLALMWVRHFKATGWQICGHDGKDIIYLRRPIRP